MATNEQTRRVEIPSVQPPRMTPRPGVAPKPMAKKNNNDGLWMAGVAALMGVGLGVAGTALAGTNDDDPVGTANDVRDAEDQIGKVLNESQEAQDKMAEDAKPVVEEEVIVEHHHHYHDRPVPPPAGITDEEVYQGGGTTTGDDAEIEVIAYERAMGEDGQMYDCAYIKVGENYGILMDSNLDGVADKLVMDMNNDGTISNEEIVDLKTAGIADVPMQPFAQEVNFDYANMQPHASYANAYMPDGTEGGLVDNGEGFEPDYTEGGNVDDDDVFNVDHTTTEGDETDGVIFVSNDEGDDIIFGDDIVELSASGDVGEVEYASLSVDSGDVIVDNSDELLVDNGELLAEGDELTIDSGDMLAEDADFGSADDGSGMTAGDDGLDSVYV